MAASKKILTSLGESLKTFVNDKTVIYEYFSVTAQELESRQNIKRARIALYFMPEIVNTKIGAEKPGDSRQLIGIDISVVRAYRHDEETKGEFPLLDLKDKIIEWSKIVNAYATTTGFLSSFGYDNSQNIQRFPRYAHQTLQFSGHRDLIKTQTT